MPVTWSQFKWLSFCWHLTASFFWVIDNQINVSSECPHPYSYALAPPSCTVHAPSSFAISLRQSAHKIQRRMRICRINSDCVRLGKTVAIRETVFSKSKLHYVGNILLCVMIWNILRFEAISYSAANSVYTCYSINLWRSDVKNIAYCWIVSHL